MNYLQSIQLIKNNIKDICEKKKLDANLIKIIAVSKQFPAPTINHYLKEVQNIFSPPLIGENKSQEILEKKSLLKYPHQCHFIGHLQTNKVKKTLGVIDYLHSLDRLELAKKINFHLEENQQELPTLLQINTSGEESKFGCRENEVLKLVEECLNLKQIKLMGLMTMAPFTNDEKIIREAFIRLRNWKEKLNHNYNLKLQELSMGMSNDYQIAIEEGSTMIRVGRAIFGERQYK